jgi:hypothetical protein
LYEAQLPTCRARIESLEKDIAQLGVKENFEDHLEEPENVTRLKNSIRLWQEIEHRVLFFIASVHHQLGNGDQEEANYELASTLRSQMLSEFEKAFVHHRSLVKKAFDAHQDHLLNEPITPVDMAGGLITHKLFVELEPLEDALLDQWNYIMGWRDEVNAILVSLESGDGSEEEDEFAAGIRNQEVAMAYQDVLKIVLIQRKELLICNAKNHPGCDHCGNVILEGKVAEECSHMFCKMCVKQMKPGRGGACACIVCGCKVVIAEMQVIEAAIEAVPNYKLPTTYHVELFKKIEHLRLFPEADSYKALMGKFKAILARSDLPDGERNLAQKASRHMAKQLDNQQKQIHILEK